MAPSARWRPWAATTVRHSSEWRRGAVAAGGRGNTVEQADPHAARVQAIAGAYARPEQAPDPRLGAAPAARAPAPQIRGHDHQTAHHTPRAQARILLVAQPGAVDPRDRAAAPGRGPCGPPRRIRRAGAGSLRPSAVRSRVARRAAARHLRLRHLPPAPCAQRRGDRVPHRRHESSRTAAWLRPRGRRLRHHAGRVLRARPPHPRRPVPPPRRVVAWWSRVARARGRADAAARARSLRWRAAASAHPEGIRAPAAPARASGRGAELRRDLDRDLGLRDVRLAQLRRGAHLPPATQAPRRGGRATWSRRCAGSATRSASASRTCQTSIRS